MEKLIGREVTMVIEPGHCAGVAAALRKLADRLDSLELANNMPTTLNA